MNEKEMFEGLIIYIVVYILIIIVIHMFVIIPIFLQKGVIPSNIALIEIYFVIIGFITFVMIINNKEV